MGLFTRRKPEPVQPTYSELGIELYRLLEENEGDWQHHEYKYGPDISNGLLHKPTQLFIYWRAWDYTNQPVVRRSIHDTDSSYNSLLTPDDLQRIKNRVWDIRNRRNRERLHDEMKKALSKIKPNPFDVECRQLARLVLLGDVSAARPLLDKCMETVMETG